MGEKESGRKIPWKYLGILHLASQPPQCCSNVIRPLVNFSVDCHLVIAYLLSIAERWAGDRCNAGNGPASTNGNIIACNPN